MAAPAVVDVFQTFNKKTKTGMPLRWRWRILDKDGDESKGPHSFRTEQKCVANLEANAPIPNGVRARRLNVHGQEF